MTAPQVLHPRQPAGTPVGGQFTRTRRAEGDPLEHGATAPALHIMGVTDEQTECDKCGKVELKRTVIVHDEDGNEHGRYGTSCASRVLGVKWTASDVDKLENNRRQLVVSDIRKAGGHLQDGNPDMAAEYLADVRTTGLHRPDELKKWDELFVQIPPEIYSDRPHFIARLGIEPTARNSARTERVRIHITGAG